jgi:glycosyltransferase involved in cell wall biosynthesis
MGKNKMNDIKNILLVCTEPFVTKHLHSGWYQFTLPIVNALANCDRYKVTFFYCKQADNCIIENRISAKTKTIPFYLPKNKYLRLLFRFYSYSLLKNILKTVHENSIDLVHFLAVDYSVANILQNIQKQVPTIWTVHDLVQHEGNKGLYSKFIKSGVNKCIKISSMLSTCSHEQQINLKKLYPKKRIFYFPLPSQIHDDIQKGSSVCPELSLEFGYILFFGRILLYKGVEILHKAWLQSGLSDKVKLVLAGKSNYNLFENQELNKNLIFINRRIEPSEIRSLFENAKCVVYPYISITQSGVLSFPYYFGVPAITSDLDYFKREIVDGKTGLLFKNRDENDLAKKLISIFDGSVDLEKIKIAGKEQYENLFGEERLFMELKNIYESIV